MPTFADVALPSAVRRDFTYSVPDHFVEKVRIGQRVWVPFRNYNAIGVITRIHEEEPDFETKEVRRLLDKEPVLDSGLVGPPRPGISFPAAIFACVRDLNRSAFRKWNRRSLLR